MGDLSINLCRNSGLGSLSYEQAAALVEDLANGRPVDLSQHPVLERARRALAVLVSLADLADLRRLSAEAGATTIALTGRLHQPWWTDHDDALPILLFTAPCAWGQPHPEDVERLIGECLAA